MNTIDSEDRNALTHTFDNRNIAIIGGIEINQEDLKNSKKRSTSNMSRYMKKF